MAKEKSYGIYDISFNERDAEILNLEGQKAQVTEDLEKAITEFAKLSKKRKLIKKKRKLCSLLLDGKDPDKI